MVQSSAATPFRIEVPDDVLADLRDRLARTRWPAQLDDAGWDYGTELSYLQELCAYWQNDFDWRAAEARLNSWPQFETEVDGEHLHFIHARSPHADALPLIITHGWPGSVVEFLDILGPLTDPVAHGGDAAGCVPRRVSLDAGLRMVGAHAPAGLGHPPSGRGERDAHGASSDTSATARKAATGARSRRRCSDWRTPII